MGKIVLVSILPTSKKRLLELQGEEISLTELFNWSMLPLGILSIESYIKKSNPNLTTEIVDLNRTFLKKINESADYKTGLKEVTDHYTQFVTAEIIDICDREQVDIIGLSALFDISLSTLLLVADEVKKAAPNTLIVAGGYPCSNFSSEIVTNNSAVDAICLGEGEIPFAELVNAANMREYLNTSPYFVTKTHAGTTKGFVCDINDIPIFNYDAYIAKYGEDVIREYVNVLAGGKSAYGSEGILLTSRGCPFRCTFCAAHSIHGRGMRYLHMDRVKQEVDFWIENYNVTAINIIDDHLLGDIDRLIEIIDYIGSRGRNSVFANTFSFASINQAFVDCLVRNNIKDVQFALESGSARVLKELMHKPIQLKRVDEVLAMFKSTDIFIKISLLVGFPDETVDDIKEALAYLRKADYHWATISNLIPISGSEVHKQIIEDSGTEYKIDNANVFKARYANPETVEFMLGDIKYTMNLDLNFVHNGLMRMGKYRLAAERFEAILRSYPTHAFAHYYLAKCLEKLGEDGSEHYRQFRRLSGDSEVWSKYAAHFGLE